MHRCSSYSNLTLLHFAWSTSINLWPLTAFILGHRIMTSLFKFGQSLMGYQYVQRRDINEIYVDPTGSDRQERSLWEINVAWPGKGIYWSTFMNGFLINGSSRTILALKLWAWTVVVAINSFHNRKSYRWLNKVKYMNTDQTNRSGSITVISLRFVTVVIVMMRTESVTSLATIVNIRAWWNRLALILPDTPSLIYSRVSDLSILMSFYTASYGIVQTIWDYATISHIFGPTYFNMWMRPNFPIWHTLIAKSTVPILARISLDRICPGPCLELSGWLGILS